MKKCPKVEQWFANHYHCRDCDMSWNDEWSCACDDECPNCGVSISPIESIEIKVEEES